MVLKHIRETLADPNTWRDVTKDLVKDAIKWTVRGVVLIAVGLWLGSKLDPTLAALWAKLTGAFGPPWQSLWKPLGVPRVLVGIALLYALWRVVEWWRHRATPVDVPAVVQVVQPAPVMEAPVVEEPPQVGELDERQTRALRILYDNYPGFIALGQLAGMVGYSYGRGEQLAEGLQRMQLAKVSKNPWHGTQVQLTERGRDLCIERGLAHR
jgi:hypothetical protein